VKILDNAYQNSTNTTDRQETSQDEDAASSFDKYATLRTCDLLIEVSARQSYSWFFVVLVHLSPAELILFGEN